MPPGHTNKDTMRNKMVSTHVNAQRGRERGLRTPTREKHTHGGTHRTTTPNARETDGAGKGVTLGKVHTPRKEKRKQRGGARPLRAHKQ